MIALRFVHCPSLVGDAILAATGGRYSHVEAVMPDGRLLGAHSDGGVMARASDYDHAQWQRELRISFPSATSADESAFWKFAESHIGEPYDFSAILGFVLHADMHAKAHAICSAFMSLCLRRAAIVHPLAQPSWEISPRDLHLGLSMQMDLPAETINPAYKG